MTDVEARLIEARALLPDAPEVPEATMDAVRLATQSARRTGSARRVRNGRVGGALALAAALTVVGLASGGVLPFQVSPSAGEQVFVPDGVIVGSVRGGAEKVVVAPGRGINAGSICVTLANAQGPSEVSPVACQPSSRSDGPGFDYSERRPGESSWAVHVRVPDVRQLASAIVSEYEIPAAGGTVVFESGDRRITRTYPDLRVLDARADADLRAYVRQGLARVRADLATPSAQRAFSDLTGQQQTALSLRVVDGLDYPVVAERMGTTVMEARQHVSAALKALGIEMNGMLP